ncbi:MAG: hypothetical protein H6713_35255 [Myxococcales bacterium]|nr:hypothetical protein [Myxococcales bacterium]
MVAQYTIAAGDWLLSCRARGPLGLCVTWTPDPRSPAQRLRDRVLAQREREFEQQLRAYVREQLRPRYEGRYRGRWYLDAAIERELPGLREELRRRAAGEAPRPWAVDAPLKDGRPPPPRQPDHATKARSCDELHALHVDRVVVRRRDARRARAAQERFEDVLQRAHKLRRSLDVDALTPRRREALIFALAMTKVYRADAALEEMLSVELPRGLQFHVEEYKKDSGIPRWEMDYRDQQLARDDSIKRFRQFYEDQLLRGQELDKAYHEVIAEKRGPWAMLEAAARVGFTRHAFAERLRGASLPRAAMPMSAAHAYCDALEDQAVPIEQSAGEALTYCLDRATTFQFFTPAARVCEELLTRAQPTQEPATLERIQGTPHAVHAPWQPERGGLVLEPPPAPEADAEARAAAELDVDVGADSVSDGGAVPRPEDEPAP